MLLLTLVYELHRELVRGFLAPIPLRLNDTDGSDVSQVCGKLMIQDKKHDLRNALEPRSESLGCYTTNTPRESREAARSRRTAEMACRATCVQVPGSSPTRQRPGSIEGSADAACRQVEGCLGSEGIESAKPPPGTLPSDR
ncbi:hypothetical protein JHW43_000347 [Diplocarpon mali]|nr:hypothetical protein JHW43_000347 [Diplocarpon mali]